MTFNRLPLLLESRQHRKLEFAATLVADNLHGDFVRSVISRLVFRSDQGRTTDWALARAGTPRPFPFMYAQAAVPDGLGEADRR